MNTRKELSFDGFGINGPDEFRSRLATFAPEAGSRTKEVIKHYGKLFENAPEMLALLRLYLAGHDKMAAKGYLSLGLDMGLDLDMMNTARDLLKEFPQ